MINKYAIIVAGGKGVRMGGDIPKQFLLLSGKPLIMHTLEAFYNADPQIDLIVVLPKSQRCYWDSLCKQFGFEIKHRVVNGGNTRYESVKNGLALLNDMGLVAVHDGVRPFINVDLIERCYNTAAQFGTAVPVTELTESIRRLSEGTSFSEHRETFRLVQTPQTFQLNVLKKAYQLPYSESFTDDASVVEAAGFKIELVIGCRENIKITTQLDLMQAEQIIKTGFGTKC